MSSKRRSLTLILLMLAVGFFVRAQYVPVDTLGYEPQPRVNDVSLAAHADSVAVKRNVNSTSGEIEQFSNNFESVVYVPKGQWITGVSLSYSQSNQNKYQFFIVENLSGDTYSFKVSPMLLFAFKNDLAAGAKFSYTRSLTKLEDADIVLDSETDYNVEKLYRLSHNYYGTALMRMYFSIGNSTRFGFFNEVQCQLGGGQSKLTTGSGKSLTGAYERNFSLDLGLSPGLCVFLNNYSAMEVNIGVLGFSYTDTRSTRDQIYVSTRNSKSANFRINLFSITFGMAFYL